MSICIQIAARLHRARPHLFIRSLTHSTRLESTEATVIREHGAQSPEELKHWLWRHSPRNSLYDQNRPRVLDRLTRNLISQQRYSDAIGVYKRLLDEGFHASPSVMASMAVITGAITPTQPQDQVLSIILPIVSDASFDEHTLRELVDLFSSHGFDPSSINSLVAHYVASRGVDYFPSHKLRSQLVRIHREANSLRHAERWLGVDAEAAPKKEDSHPFAALLAGSGDSEGILLRMKQYGITPDTSIFNALIGTQKRDKAYDRVFELYRLMKLANVTPDTSTFASLFSTLHKMNHLELNAPRSRLHPIPPGPLNIRTLYRDMLSYHFSATTNNPIRPSSIVSSSVLSFALRAFLSRCDYYGAFVVIRSFSICGFKPGLGTYTMVIRQLALQSSPPRFPQHVDLGDGLEARLNKNKKYWLYFEDSEVPEEFPLGVLPLQRLLRKKILSALKAEAVEDPMQRLRELLQTTKAEMIPDVPQAVKQKKGGRRRRADTSS